MLSVIFSTYNGEDTLPLMLKSLTECVTPDGGWQLIAVDNASDDNSFAILEEYQNDLPITILREQRQGKNFALNTAIEAALGDLIIFTDDDVIVDPNWLVNYRQQVDFKPEASILGGAIEPFWMEEPPAWILDWIDCAWVFALTPSKLKEGEVVPGRIFGPNMAIRKEIFDQGYRYDNQIGPDGSNTYIMGSETSFTKMLAAEGYTSFHLPGVKVSHIIHKYQLDRKWILSRAVRGGRGEFIETRSKYKKYKRWNHVPRYFLRHYLQHKIRLIWFYIFNNPKNIFIEQWNVDFTKGKILQAYRYYSEQSQS